MCRFNHPARFGMTSLLSLVFFAPATTALSDTIFSNTTPISIPATTGGATLPVTSVPYPSQITVSGMVGTLTSVFVTLHNWTDDGSSANSDDLYFLLTGPGGQAFDFLGDVGSNHLFEDVSLTLTDSASTSLIGLPITSSGSFKPTVVGTVCPAFPSPAPSSINCAAPQGTTTFATEFFGADPDGTWSLYAFDDTAGDTASTISGGWSLAVDSTGGFVAPQPTPEPAGLTLVGLAMGLFAIVTSGASRRLRTR
jgi:hypothetical protein